MRTLLSFTGFIIVALIFQGCGPDVDPNNPGGHRMAKAQGDSNSRGIPKPASTPAPSAPQGQATQASSGQVASQTYIRPPLKAPAQAQNAPPRSVEAQAAPQYFAPNRAMPTSALPPYHANRSRSSENPVNGAIAASTRMPSQTGTPSSTVSAPAASDSSNQLAWTDWLAFSSRNTTNDQVMVKIRRGSGRHEKFETLTEAMKNGDLVLVPASQGKAAPTSNIGATEETGSYSLKQTIEEIASLDEALGKYHKSLRIDPAYGQWAKTQNTSKSTNSDSLVQIAQTKIHFSSGDPSLTNQATEELDLIALLMKSDKRYIIAIPESDSKRSLTEVTISYLIQHDISPGRIFTIGYGSRPLISQTTETNSVPITLYSVRDSNPYEAPAFAFFGSLSKPTADTSSTTGTTGDSSSASAAGSPSAAPANQSASIGSLIPASSPSTSSASASASAFDQSSQLAVASTSSAGSISPSQPSHSASSNSSQPGTEAGTNDSYTSDRFASEPAQGEALTREQLIQRMIQNSLRGDATLTEANIEVKVADNKIELTGTVANKQQKKIAGQVAGDYANGLKVLNHLKVQSETRASPAAPEH